MKIRLQNGVATCLPVRIC